MTLLKRIESVALCLCLGLSLLYIRSKKCNNVWNFAQQGVL